MKVRKTVSASEGITEQKLQNEIQFRSWFPAEAVLDARNRIPDEECDRLVEGFRLFCLQAIRIKVPGSRVPFELREAQLDTIRAWIQNRYTITLKARQIGFSTLAAAFALWVALGGSDRQIYMLSRREKDSISLLNKVKFAYKSMPEWVRQRSSHVLDRTNLRMSFDNDSFIESSPTASDPIRGETAFLVIVDEWASFQNEEEAWAAIEPVTDVGGRCVGLSTAKGEGTFFHRLWVGATTSSNSFVPVFHPWSAVPGRDAKWYEDKKANMELWQLHQEYPCSPEEAFIGSGNPYFDLERLREMSLKEGIGRYFIQISSQGGNRFELTEASDNGPLVVFEKPKRSETYVIGADVAQGLDHGDWSVAYVMEAKSGDIVAVFRGKPEPDYFGEIIAALGYMYNYALVCPEVNNHGRTTVDTLRRLKYSRIYRRRTKLKTIESPTETIGWLTTHGNKVDVINQLSQWLRVHNVPHEPTVAELKTFVRDQRGERIKLHGSPHDDCVMALAITIEARKYAVMNNIGSVIPKDVPGSIDWWAKKLTGPSRKRRVGPMI